MRVSFWLFITGWGFILWGLWGLYLFYKWNIKRGISSFLYDLNITNEILSLDIGFGLTIFSLSKILHYWWHHRLTYLIVMLYAILVFFAYQYIIKKFKVNDIVNYSFSKGISYIYLIVALYQFYRFLTYG